MAAAAILKNTIPVEPPVCERNSCLVTSTQKSNYCRVILTFKGSLFLRAAAISAANRKSKNGSKCLCFGSWRSLKSEFEGSKLLKGTCTKQNTSFELLNVRISLALRPVGEMRKRKIGRTYPLLVTDQYIWFAQIHSLRNILVVLPGLRKHAYNRWNFVAIIYTSWDIRYFPYTSGQWPPS